jgi:thiol-disulfide isomerase/thioredoxin
LLASQVVANYPGKVRFVVENLGESKLAERFGVKAYPALFVDDVLVAAPQDFGFFGGLNTGRYAPWSELQGRERFQKDLTRMLDLVLSGKKDELARERGTVEPQRSISTLPEFTIKDLSGNTLTAEQLRGRMVVVEFWATWCPPCRSTLEWLVALQKKYGDHVAVVAFSVDSPDEEVRKLTRHLSKDLHWAIATPDIGVAFGDVVSIPTLLLFDGQGKAAGAWYGAAPDLHDLVEKKLDLLATGE